MRNLPPLASRYIRLIIGLGAASLVYAWWDTYVHHYRFNAVFVLLGCATVMLTARRQVKLFRKHTSVQTGNTNSMTMSLAFIPTFLMIASLGPLASCIAALFNMEPFWERVQLHRRLFNAAAIMISSLVACAILRPLGLAPGTWDIVQLVQRGDVHSLFFPLVGIVFATGVYWVVNTGIVATVIAILSKKTPLSVWYDQCRWMWPGYFLGASCATMILGILPELGVAFRAGAPHSLGMARLWMAVFIIVAVPIPIGLYLLVKYHEQADEEKQARIDVLSQNQAELQEINVQLGRSKEELQQLYTSTVESLALAIDAKDRYTKEHIQRVKGITVSIAQEMGLIGDDLKAVETGALLHDIGKIAVPEHILTKPGRLSDEEFDKIKAHPEMGARILEPVQFPFPVMPIVKHHHERWDGSGYPDGLAGEAIPLGGRILAVGDVYDALTSDRSYRRGWTHERALAYLRENAGTHFDPEVVTAFERVVKNHPEIFEVRSTLLPGAGGMGSRSVHDAVSSGVTSFEYLALYEISQAISATVNLPEMLTMLAEKVRQLFEASACVVLLAGEDPLLGGARELRVQRAVGDYERLFRNGHTLFGFGATGQAAATAQGVVTAFDPEDILTESIPGGPVLGDPLQAAVIAPLTADGVVIGTLNVYQNRLYAFDSEALRVLQVIALQAGRALQKAIEFDRTLESALTDALTGLYNARHLNLFLERELERADLEERPLSVLVLDLDNFKPVNDMYGHTWGNEVLRDLGRLFQGALRSGDLVARYAGDEFVVVLPTTGAHEARVVIDKIRTAIRGYDARPPGADETETMTIEVSIGMASYPEDGRDATALITIADRAMFKDKKQRKGEAVIADELAARSLKLVA